jgi:2-keto-4-pentenoate hydratase
VSNPVEEAIKVVADALSCADRDRRPISPIRDRLPALDIQTAYAVQRFNTQRRLGAGQRLSGRKVGLTSRAVQQQLGVDQPDFGMLFRECEFGDGEVIPWDELLQPRCEAEVALVIGRELTDPQMTLTRLMCSVEYALPAIEVVDSRIEGWDINIVDTIADNASAGKYVLGTQPVRLSDVDLRLAGMLMECCGQPVSLGVGAACLGNPLNAALWAARTLAAVGIPLTAGDVLLTGALGPMVPAKPGDRFEAAVQGLGSVRAVFGGPT